jgi:hypothetical protein
MQTVCQPLGVTHQAGGSRILAHADEETLARRPGSRNGARLQFREQLLVDALGCPAQGELA